MRSSLRRRWGRAVLAAAALLAQADALLRARCRVKERKAAVLEPELALLRAENDLLRARLRRMPGRHRPRYTPWHRLRILWHRARYRLSLEKTAKAFVLRKATLHRWLAALETGHEHLIAGRHPARRLPDLVHEVAALLRRDQPSWGSRRIAHTLVRLGLQVSRSSVQRLLRRHGIRHRCGAVRSPQSVALIERLWRSMKEESVLTAALLILAPHTLETRLQRWVLWFNRHRPHQGLRGRTPDDVLTPHLRPPPRLARTAGTWVLARANLHREHRLPVYSLRPAA